MDIIMLILGTPNYSTVSLEDIQEKFSRSNLIGKRVNLSSENEINPKGFNSQHVKAIVSGDRMDFERKYESPTSEPVYAKLIFSVNNLPYTPDKSFALFRRIFIIPFNRTFDEKEADKHLKNELMKELPGIFCWMVQGLKRLKAQNYNFTESKIIAEAIENYKKTQNDILLFITEILTKGTAEERIDKKTILRCYNHWLESNGLGNMTISAKKFWNLFSANCKKQGLPYDTQRSNGKHYLKGIKLKSDVVQSYKHVIASSANTSTKIHFNKPIDKKYDKEDEDIFTET